MKYAQGSLRKTAGKVPLILGTLTSCCDSHFERSNTSFSENKLDGVDRRDCSVRKNREKFLWFSVD